MADRADDIIKYKRGELTPQEMHALEKRALTDPFLAEALEGIESVSNENLSADVAELHQRISNSKKSSRVLIWRIAAGVILSATLIFATYQFIPRPEPLAVKTEKNTPATVPPKPPADETEKSVKGNAAVTTSEPSKKELPTHKKQETKVQPEKLAEHTPPMAMSKEKNTESLNGDAQKDKLSPSDEMATAHPAPMSGLAMPKENVPVAPLAIRAEKDISSSVSKKGSMESAARPEGGFEAFERYIDSNLRFPERALENNISGVVIIELTVTASGSPKHLKVVKSLGYGCDEEATRLVKEGPAWISASDNGQPTESIVQVHIKFNLPKPNR